MKKLFFIKVFLSSLKQSLYRVVRRILLLLKIRIGFIASGSIGHLIVEMEMAIFHSKNPKRDYWFPAGRISNRYVVSEYSRYTNFVTQAIFLQTIGRLLVSATRGDAQLDANCEVGFHTVGYLDCQKPLLRVRNHGELENFLELHEINGKPIITLCVRDGYHSKKWYGANVEEETRYRNVDINECKEMINFFLARGFAVIRMGRDAFKLSFERKGLVDYANCELRSDSLDVAIFNQSKFCLSTGTGLDDFATAFRKRVYQFDCSPFFDVRLSMLRPIVLPKNVINKETGMPIGLKEMHERSFGYLRSSKQYLDSEVELENNSSDTLVLFAHHILDFERGQSMHLIDSQIQNYFKSIVMNDHNSQSVSLQHFVPILSPLSKNYFI